MGHARLVQIGRAEAGGGEMAMVVREFVRQRIAPLQRHAHLMWTFSGSGDPMRLQVPPLPSDTLQEVLRLLTGGDLGALPFGGRLL